MSKTDEVTTRSSTSIMERARAAQAAKRAADEAARYEYAERRRAELRSEWRPIADAVLAQVKHQLGDDSETVMDKDGPSAYYYGAGWMLAQPDNETTLQRNSPLSNIAYRPMKLAIEGIRVPVMCWSDGRAEVCFEPADIALDDEDDYASLWMGGGGMTDWGIQTGNSNLLVAIAAAADKEAEYLEKARRAQQINDERAIQAATVQPEPAKPAADNLESAGEILRRFAAGDYCVSAFAAQPHDDADLKYSDNRAFLIASQIHALAVEVRELRNTMENRP